ncbi:hypothetical protein ES703_30593 [subsurface metagenome]
MLAGYDTASSQVVLRKNFAVETSPWLLHQITGIRVGERAAIYPIGYKGIKIRTRYKPPRGTTQFYP